MSWHVNLKCVLYLYQIEQSTVRNCLAALEPEEKAITDGRIGPEIVGIDRNSLCGSMDIKEGIEVST